MTQKSDGHNYENKTLIVRMIKLSSNIVSSDGNNRSLFFTSRLQTVQLPRETDSTHSNALTC